MKVNSGVKGPSVTSPALCDRCAERIGVYEPMIVVLGGLPRETSRAAEPEIGLPRGERYHRACYLESLWDARALQMPS